MENAEARVTPADELIGHTSAASAYLVADYPYTRTETTQLRAWVETTRYGQRFVSQVWEPTRGGRWKRPHASRYAPVTVLYLGASGHVEFAQLERQASEAALTAFERRYPVTCGRPELEDVVRLVRAEARARRKMVWQVPASGRRLRLAHARQQTQFRRLVELEWLALQP